MKLVGTTDSTNWGKPLSKLANLGIDYLIPRTAPIAIASCAVGWYSYRYLMTYSQQIIADSVTERFKNIFGETIGGYTGHFFAPLVVPEASPYFATELSVGFSLATSLVLNVAARLFCGIKKQSGGEAYLKKIAEKSLPKTTPETPPPKKPIHATTTIAPEAPTTQAIAHKTFRKSLWAQLLNPCDCY